MEILNSAGEEEFSVVRLYYTPDAGIRKIRGQPAAAEPAL